RHILIAALLVAPARVGGGDLADVFRPELTPRTGDHYAKLPCINVQDFAAPVAVTIGALVAGQKPEAGWNLRRIEELAGQRDHAIHRVGLDHLPANFAFA